MCTHLTFNLEKATQSLNFFAIKAGGSINKMKAIKLLYFADRYHTRTYGRPISNDQYLAMKYGPVGSSSKDIAENSDFLGDYEKEYTSRFLNTISSLEYESINGVDENVFSETDLEALSFAWEKFSQYDQFELAEITHKFPEWIKHQTKLESGYSRILMDYEDFFADPSEDRYFQIDEEIKEFSLSALKEYSTVEKLWN